MARRKIPQTGISGLGTTATVDTGTAEGQIPVLGSGGKLAVARLPTGTAQDQVPILGSGGKLDQAVVSVGGQVQVVNSQGGAVATGTTTVPNDDTIPQNTAGTEFMTLAITPTHASNKLLIEAILFLANTVAGHMTVALFQDSTAGALAASVEFIETANAARMVVLRYEMAAGTTSATTFKIRAGLNNAGTTTFNGTSGARLYGGVLNSVLRITEIKV